MPNAEGPGADWRPSGSLDALRFVASLRAGIREWMAARDVLEVSTPVLSAAAPSDVHLDAFRTGGAPPQAARYLQTSPEYPMKRLLVAHGVDIYQIAPVFRAGERGRRHNPEFTMLEWYRVGMDHEALMDDVESLLSALWARAGLRWRTPARRACRDVVDEALGRDGRAPVSGRDDVTFADAVAVRRRFAALGRSWPDSIGDDADAALDLLLDELALPAFAGERITFLHGWPPSQAALARLGRDADGHRVAERFELYAGALELGNGYHELADAAELRARFERDLARRRALGRETPPLDERLLAAQADGLPDCAGVAIGLERLAMAMRGATSIDEVMAFGHERA